MAAIGRPLDQRGVMADAGADLLHFGSIPDVHLTLEVLEASNQQEPVERRELEGVPMVDSKLKNRVSVRGVDDSVGWHETALHQEPASLREPTEAVDRPCIGKDGREFLCLGGKKIKGVFPIIGSPCLIDEIACLDEQFFS
jgi:hypothetical protein